ncbi:hypothetical protein E1J53_0010565 [Lewinella sp. W8]|nr:hypothetical protein [Lewinella sp. W8]
MLVFALILAGCEKDSIAPNQESAPAPMLSLKEAVQVNPDGSYKFTLTGAQIAYIVDQELGPDSPEAFEDKHEAFRSLLAVDVNQKSASSSSTITYSLGAEVVTQLSFTDPPNDWIYDFEGIGGLEPFVDVAHFEARQSRIFGTFAIMRAYADAYTSAGQGIFNRADSSADITSCTNTRRNPRRVVGEAEISLDINAVVDGFAVVECRSGLVEAEPVPLEPSIE